MTTVWSIVIPTFHRPDLLQAAVASCRALVLPAGSGMEIVIVDNSAGGDAEDQCRAFGCDGLVYVHEPRAGLAYARNRGIEAAQGDFLAFLDDDEQAEPDWLIELDRAFRESGAEVVCGAVLPQFEAAPAAHHAYVAGFYTRDLDRAEFADISDILNYVGTGNSAYRRIKCFGSGIRVDHRFNRFGGEDIELFRTLKRAGCRFAWAPKAKVLEWISVERASLPYLRERRRSQGQQRVDGLWRAGSGGRLRVPVFMAGGVAQAGLHFLLSLFHRVTGQHDRAAEHAVEIQGGLGKLFWIGAARRHRYGSGPSA